MILLYSDFIRHQTFPLLLLVLIEGKLPNVWQQARHAGGLGGPQSDHGDLKTMAFEAFKAIKLCILHLLE